MKCIGCQLANKEIETYVIYEDEWITCILDIDPIQEGHTLILPKKHVEDLNQLDKVLSQTIMNTSMKISEVLTLVYKPDGITIIQNNGIFNDLNHYHMHVFPRYKDDGFGWVEPKIKQLIPLEEVKKKIIQWI